MCVWVESERKNHIQEAENVSKMTDEATHAHTRFSVWEQKASSICFGRRCYYYYCCASDRMGRKRRVTYSGREEIRRAKKTMSLKKDEDNLILIPVSSHFLSIIQSLSFCDVKSLPWQEEEGEGGEEGEKGKDSGRRSNGSSSSSSGENFSFDSRDARRLRSSSSFTLFLNLPDSSLFSLLLIYLNIRSSLLKTRSALSNRLRNSYQMIPIQQLEM